jgi:hypothetical protein
MPRRQKPVGQEGWTWDEIDLGYRMPKASRKWYRLLKGGHPYRSRGGRSDSTPERKREPFISGPNAINSIHPTNQGKPRVPRYESVEAVKKRLDAQYREALFTALFMLIAIALVPLGIFMLYLYMLGVTR